MGIFLGVAKISNIFFGVLEKNPDIYIFFFLVKGRCWACVCSKKESTPPSPRCRSNKKDELE